MYEKIKEEIRSQKKLIEGLFTPHSNEYYAAQDEAYNNLLSFIESLEKEEEKKKSGCGEDNTDYSQKEHIGVKESPSKTFPNANIFEVDSSYRH